MAAFSCSTPQGTHFADASLRHIVNTHHITIAAASRRTSHGIACVTLRLLSAICFVMRLCLCDRRLASVPGLYFRLTTCRFSSQRVLQRRQSERRREEKPNRFVLMKLCRPSCPTAPNEAAQTNTTCRCHLVYHGRGS